MSKPSLLWDFDSTFKSSFHSLAAARATNSMVKLTETFPFVFFFSPFDSDDLDCNFWTTEQDEKTPLSSGREGAGDAE